MMGGRLDRAFRGACHETHRYLEIHSQYLERTLIRSLRARPHGVFDSVSENYIGAAVRQRASPSSRRRRVIQIAPKNRTILPVEGLAAVFGLVRFWADQNVSREPNLGTRFRIAPACGI